MMSESIRDGYKMTEMGELPEEWEIEILGNIFSLSKESCVPYITPEKYFIHYSIPAWDEVKGPIIQLGSEIESNKFFLKSPCILVSKLNPRKPRVAIVQNTGEKFPLCASTEFMVYVPKSTQTDLIYFSYYLASDFFHIRLQQVATGTTNSHVRAHPSETLSWWVPKFPFPEQHHIAEILSTIDETIERTEALIEKYRHIKAGLMSDLLTRGIDEEGRIRSEETHEFKDSPLGRVPDEWMVGTLSDIAQIEMGQSPDGNTYNSVGNGKPLLNGPVEFGVYHPTPIQWTSKPTKMCNQKDILFCVRGSTTGRMNIANQEYCIGRGIAAICGILNISDTSYIKYYLDRENQFIFSLATGGGSTFPNITSKDLSNLPCMYPSLPEQHHIAEILTVTDTYIEKEQTYLNKLQQIKKGLMQDLLTGKVRVTTTLAPPKPAEAAT